MKVSIIIPVYNKENYVEKSVRSALNQDFEDFEVIAIDDESTDQSGVICDRLAQEDARLRVFHTPNSGVTGARLYGLEQAKADYVMFLDSDDELLPNALKSTYPVIIRENADEVFGTYKDQYGHHYVSSHEGWVKDVDSLIMEACSQKAVFSYIWGMLYRKDILEGCFNKEMGRSYLEDKLTQMRVLMKQPKVYFIKDCIYLYNVGIPGAWNGSTISKDIAIENELKNIFDPRWERLETAYTMLRIKEYERYLYHRDFAACEHYQDLRHVKNRMLSLPSRIVISMPPRIAWIPVWLYKRLKRLSKSISRQL